MPKGGEQEERVQDAVSKALSYLQKRDRTRRQIELRLAERGIEAGVAEQALEELERLDYVNDERFARNYAEDRRNLDGWGSERIAAKLHEAGVPPAWWRKQPGVATATMSSPAPSSFSVGACLPPRPTTGSVSGPSGS